MPHFDSHIKAAKAVQGGYGIPMDEGQYQVFPLLIPVGFFQDRGRDGK